MKHTLRRRAQSELLFLKHLKKLKNDRDKTVELFGKEQCGDANQEQWWYGEQPNEIRSAPKPPSMQVSIPRAQRSKLVRKLGQLPPRRMQLSRDYPWNGTQTKCRRRLAEN